MFRLFWRDRYRQGMVFHEYLETGTARQGQTNGFWSFVRDRKTLKTYFLLTILNRPVHAGGDPKNNEQTLVFYDIEEMRNVKRPKSNETSWFAIILKRRVQAGWRPKKHEKHWLLMIWKKPVQAMWRPKKLFFLFLINLKRPATENQWKTNGLWYGTGRCHGYKPVQAGTTAARGRELLRGVRKRLILKRLRKRWKQLPVIVNDTIRGGITSEQSRIGSIFPQQHDRNINNKH